jgi:hypothetical protein
MGNRFATLTGRADAPQTHFQSKELFNVGR